MDLNKVMLIGRITSDLDVKKMGDSGNSVVNFNLATNRVYTNSSGDKIEETEFHRCVAYGKIAEIMGQYLSKGRKVFIEGRLRTRQWEDQSGSKRFTTEIIVNNMTFCDSKPTNNEQVSTSKDKQNDATEDEIPF